MWKVFVLSVLNGQGCDLSCALCIQFHRPCRLAAPYGSQCSQHRPRNASLERVPGTRYWHLLILLMSVCNLCRNHRHLDSDATSSRPKPQLEEGRMHHREMIRPLNVRDVELEMSRLSTGLEINLFENIPLVHVAQHHDHQATAYNASPRLWHSNLQIIYITESNKCL